MPIPDRRTIRTDDQEEEARKRVLARLSKLQTQLEIAFLALDEIARFSAATHGAYKVAAEALAKIRSLE